MNTLKLEINLQGTNVQMSSIKWAVGRQDQVSEGPVQSVTQEPEALGYQL